MGGVATEQEGPFTCTTQDGGHAAPIGFNPSGCRIMETATMDSAPEVGIELEVVDAPLLTQSTEHPLEVHLHLGVGAVQHIPGSTTPTAIGDPLGGQRQTVIPPSQTSRGDPETPANLALQ